MTSILRFTVFGIAIGAAMLPGAGVNARSGYVVPVVAALVLVWASCAASRSDQRVMVGLCAVGLVAVSVSLAIITVFFVGWLLIVLVPLGGAVLAGWRAVRPASLSHDRFRRWMWGIALGIAASSVIVGYGLSWSLLGAMAAILVGGYVGRAGHRVLAVLIGIALIVVAVLSLAGFAIGTALMCVNRGSCGWSGYEALRHWAGFLIVEGSLVVAAVSMFARDSWSPGQSTQPPPAAPAHHT